MKNWKKLISGVVAMMAVATAVGATPAKVPVEVLDVADATGIATGEVVSATIKAADNGGTWYIAKGNSKGAIGDVTEIENGIKIAHTSTQRNAELSAGYTTDSLYTGADTKVQFSYLVTDVREKNSQLIQVSSGVVATTQPTFAGVADCGGMSGGYFKYHNNSAIIQVSAEGIKYLDVVSGELKKVDVALKEDTVYNFRFEIVEGEGTYDLYIDEDKIGVNSTPVAENIALFNPMADTFNTVKVWLESAQVADDATTEETDEREQNKFGVTITDIRFMESKPQSITESFDKLPAKGSIETTVALDESFAYADLDEMQAAGWSVTVPTDITASAVIEGDKLKYNMNKTLAAREEHNIIAERELVGGEKGKLTLAVGFGLKDDGKYKNTNVKVEFLDTEGKSLANVGLRSAHNGTEETTPAFVLTVGTTEKIIYVKDYSLSHDGSIYKIKLVSDKKSNTVKLYAAGAEEPVLAIDGACIEGAKKIRLSQMQKSYDKGWNTNSTAYFDYVNVAYTGEGWTYYWGGNSKNGSVTANGALTLAYRADRERTASIYANYNNPVIKAYGDYEMSYEIVPELTTGNKYEAALTISAEESVSSDAEILNKPTIIAAITDSIQIVINNDKFAYGCSDENGNYFKDIAEYEYGKTYYVKVKVNNTDKTYTLWLSDAPITGATTPVVENAGFFLPSGAASNLYSAKFTVQRREEGKATVGTLKLDNLEYNKTGKDDMTVLNDDQQYMTSLGDSKYIDLINVPTDKEVIVAYYDADNKLVDVAVATGEALRAKKTDDTAVSALVMTWDDFNNILPVNAAIELK